ncbi:glycosyltransferase [Vibrio breoganii]
MKESLIFLTINYPSGTSETFIENEITTLSESYEDIYIIAENFNSSKLRNIPHNVHVREAATRNIFKLLRNIFSIEFFRDLFYECRSLDYITLHKLKRCIGFLLRSLLLKREISNIVKENDLMMEHVSLYSYWFLYGALAISYFPNVNKKISRAHGYDLYLFREKEDYQPFKQIILGRIDYLLTISKSTQKYAQDRYKQYKNKIKHSYLGTNKFKSESIHSFENSDIITVVSCSNCIELKQIDLLILALGKLESRSEKIHWIHFGDGELFENLVRLASRTLNSITFEFKGRVSNKDIHIFYEQNKIDLFINISKTEGLPVSIIEATSYGIPVIAPNIGGIKEIVNIDTGYLIPENASTEDLVGAIESFLSLSKSERLALSRNAEFYWSQNFMSINVYKNFIDSYLK